MIIYNRNETKRIKKENIQKKSYSYIWIRQGVCVCVMLASVNSKISVFYGLLKVSAYSLSGIDASQCFAASAWMMINIVKGRCVPHKQLH